MEPEKIMSGISKEILAVLKAMDKTKDIEEKKKYSEIIKNLSDSHGVYLSFISDIALYEDDGGPIPF